MILFLREVSIVFDRGPGSKNSLVSWLKDGICLRLRATGQRGDGSFGRRRAPEVLPTSEWSRWTDRMGGD